VLDGIGIEMRRSSSAGVIPGAVEQTNLGDRIAAIAPWQGETMEKVIELLHGGATQPTGNPGASVIGSSIPTLRPRRCYT